MANEAAFRQDCNSRGLRDSPKARPEGVHGHSEGQNGAGHACLDSCPSGQSIRVESAAPHRRCEWRLNGIAGLRVQSVERSRFLRVNRRSSAPPAISQRRHEPAHDPKNCCRKSAAGGTPANPQKSALSATGTGETVAPSISLFCSQGASSICPSRPFPWNESIDTPLR
jgi:hypothetical protein